MLHEMGDKKKALLELLKLVRGKSTPLDEEEVGAEAALEGESPEDESIEKLTKPAEEEMVEDKEELDPEALKAYLEGKESGKPPMKPRKGTSITMVEAQIPLKRKGKLA